MIESIELNILLQAYIMSAFIVHLRILERSRLQFLTPTGFGLKSV